VSKLAFSFSLKCQLVEESRDEKVMQTECTRISISNGKVRRVWLHYVGVQEAFGDPGQEREATNKY
jgi:hypothetical protein